MTDKVTQPQAPVVGGTMLTADDFERLDPVETVEGELEPIEPIEPIVPVVPRPAEPVPYTGPTLLGSIARGSIVLILAAIAFVVFMVFTQPDSAVATRATTTMESAKTTVNGAIEDYEAGKAEKEAAEAATAVEPDTTETLTTD